MRQAFEISDYRFQVVGHDQSEVMAAKRLIKRKSNLEWIPNHQGATDMEGNHRCTLIASHRVKGNLLRTSSVYSVSRVWQRIVPGLHFTYSALFACSVLNNHRMLRSGGTA